MGENPNRRIRVSGAAASQPAKPGVSLGSKILHSPPRLDTYGNKHKKGRTVPVDAEVNMQSGELSDESEKSPESEEHDPRHRKVRTPPPPGKKHADDGYDARRGTRREVPLFPAGTVGNMSEEHLCNMMRNVMKDELQDVKAEVKDQGKRLAGVEHYVEYNNDRLTDMQRRLHAMEAEKISNQVAIGPFPTDTSQETRISFIENALSTLSEEVKASMMEHPSKGKGDKKVLKPVTIVKFSSNAVRDAAIKQFKETGLPFEGVTKPLFVKAATTPTAQNRDYHFGEAKRKIEALVVAKKLKGNVEAIFGNVRVIKLNGQEIGKQNKDDPYMTWVESFQGVVE